MSVGEMVTPVSEDERPIGALRLSPAEVAGLTVDVLVERVRALQPLLAARAESAERERRPDDEVMDALRRTGIYYHFVPKRFGGLELGVSEFVEIVLPMAAACASTAWVTSFCMEHNLILSLYPPQAQEEIFGAQPYIIAPGAAFPPGRATAVDGGYRVTGRWNYASGVMNADWAMASMLVDRPEGREMHWLVVPMDEVEVLDVWHMDGLAATGSNDIAMNDVFVPGHRTLDMAAMSGGRAPGRALHDNPLYRMPMSTFLALTAALPLVGAARGALTCFIERTGTRVSAGVRQSERATVQAVLGRVAVAVDVAESIVRQAAVDVTRLAIEDRAGDIDARAAIRARISYAATSCRDAVRLMVDTAGSSAHDLGNPLQRAARDIAVGAAHVIQDPLTTTELYGRILLGLPPQTFLI